MIPNNSGCLNICYCLVVWGGARSLWVVHCTDSWLELCQSQLSHPVKQQQDGSGGLHSPLTMRNVADGDEGEAQAHPGQGQPPARGVPDRHRSQSQLPPAASPGPSGPPEVESDQQWVRPQLGLLVLPVGDLGCPRRSDLWPLSLVPSQEEKFRLCQRLRSSSLQLWNWNILQ